MSRDIPIKKEFDYIRIHDSGKIGYLMHDNAVAEYEDSDYPFYRHDGVVVKDLKYIGGFSIRFIKDVLRILERREKLQNIDDMELQIFFSKKKGLFPCKISTLYIAPRFDKDKVKK